MTSTRRRPSRDAHGGIDARATQDASTSGPPGPPAREVDLWMPAVYDELRRLAARYLAREIPGQTLQPTGLVHEAYLRLAGQDRARWHDRAHFFRLAARMMRRILIDRYRGRQARKRGSGAVRITLASDAARDEGLSPVDLLALDDALQGLAALDAQQAAVVELRYFAGLTVPETAEALGISAPTVKRDWALARAWLLLALQGGPDQRGR